MDTAVKLCSHLSAPRTRAVVVGGVPGLERFARAEGNVTMRFEKARQRDSGVAARRAEARLPVPDRDRVGPPAREERIAARCAHADLTVRVRERDAAIARETLEVGHRWDRETVPLPLRRYRHAQIIDEQPEDVGLVRRGARAAQARE